MVSNVVTVVGVVAVNKHIQRQHKFDYFVALSGLHFAFTAVALQVFLAFGMFEFKRAPLSLVVSKALLDTSSVGLMNLCLSHNSVGTWQLSKLSCIPVTAVLQYLVLGQSVSYATAGSLVPLCVGIAIAMVTDLHVHSKGLLLALLAVLATVLSHLVTRVFLTNTGCSSLQFLLQTAPFATLGMLALSFLLDDWHSDAGLLQYHLSSEAARDMLVSCLFALVVNISNIVVLSKSSALSYQVLGHAKTVLTLAIGFVFFDKGLSPRRAAGVGLALAGMVSYAHVRNEAPHSSAGQHSVLVGLLSAGTVAVVAAWPYLPHSDGPALPSS